MIRRTVVLSLMVLIALTALMGCQGAPLPEGMAETAVLDKGEQIVLLITQQDYEAVTQLFRQDVRETMQEKAVETLCAPILEEAGALEKIDTRRASGQQDEQSGETYAEALIIGSHEHKKVVYRMALDEQLQLIGLSIFAQ